MKVIHIKILHIPKNKPNPSKNKIKEKMVYLIKIVRIAMKMMNMDQGLKNLRPRRKNQI